MPTSHRRVTSSSARPGLGSTWRVEDLDKRTDGSHEQVAPLASYVNRLARCQLGAKSSRGRLSSVLR